MKLVTHHQAFMTPVTLSRSWFRCQC